MRRYLGMLLAAGLATAPASALATPDSKKPDTAAQVDTMKPRLGVKVLTLSSPLQTFFGSTDKTGVLVSEVLPGSAASYAGIAVGDLIQQVGDIKVDEATDVPDALAKAQKDQKVTIKLLRQHKPMTLEVKLDTTTSSLHWLPSEWLRQLFDSANGSKST